MKLYFNEMLKCLKDVGFPVDFLAIHDFFTPKLDESHLDAQILTRHWVSSYSLALREKKVLVFAA